MNSKLTQVSMIAAIGKNRELGKDNKLLWNIPEDMKHFREITRGHTVIMGRKTFESIGRPLPDRTNIIITQNLDFRFMNCMITDSIRNAIKLAKKIPGSEEIFIIGGGQIYTQGIKYADKLYLTLVDASFDADSFFPDYSDFKKTYDSGLLDSAGLKYRFVELEKR